ncbi:MAG: hypothetical protein AAGD96_20085 [Chloroflexota bacterium]
MEHFRKLEINGGTVIGDSAVRLNIPPTQSGYTNAQIDDYGGRRRQEYIWRPDQHISLSVSLSLEARFSHPANALEGTAGFGFWNAPFGDPTMPWPTLPKATWFFLSAPPGDLPLNPDGPGQGFFASTLDATTFKAISLAPLAPPVVLLNQLSGFKKRVWPRVQQALGMSYQQLDHINITEWHDYELNWRPDGCIFSVDGNIVLKTDQSPKGPLGFVCWIDNQYMAVTPTGRMSAGSRPIVKSQWLEIRNVSIQKQQS